MQKVIICGNVGRDSEITTFGDKQRLTFSVGCSEGKGEQKATTWYDVEYHSTGLQPYITKGRQVVVMGRLRIKAYTAKDGTQRIGINIFADSVELVGGPGQQAVVQPQPQFQAQAQPVAPPQPQAPQQSQGGDELPF